MQDYLILISQNEGLHARATPAERSALMEARAAYRVRNEATGAFKDAERFRPSAEGARVSKVTGETAVATGPFRGEDQALAAYCLLSAPDLDNAIGLAKDYPLGAGEALEVRPVMKGAMSSGKSDRPGRLFACAVLGQAPDETSWERIMDRIDVETSQQMSENAFTCGGVRLQAPRTGRRLVRKDETSMVLDGPFLESKEVIGGLFFLRMSDQTEAVRWAAESAFVRHGVLEIRELWRG